MLDKVYWLRKSCTRDIVAIVSNNLLFTSLQISDEPDFCLLWLFSCSYPYFFCYTFIVFRYCCNYVKSAFKVSEAYIFIAISLNYNLSRQISDRNILLLFYLSCIIEFCISSFVFERHVIIVKVTSRHS